MAEEIRTIFLNILPLTKVKADKLHTLMDNCIKGTDFLLAAISWLKGYREKVSKYSLQDKTYEYLKENLDLQAQIIIDLIKDVFTHNDSYGFKNYSIPYNVPRSGKLSVTENKNPVMSVSVSRKERIGIPIAMDGAWDRFNRLLSEGYSWSAFRVVERDDSWKIAVSLKKDFQLLVPKSVMGIDVGSRCLAAVTVISRNGVAKQLYFGSDIYEQQRNISLRRSVLQKHMDKGTGKEHAKKKLRDLKHKERNYVKTRCYQIVHQVVDLARKHSSLIAIEDLKGLRNAKGHRAANRRNKKIPYHTFRAALESVAKRQGIEIMAVSPKYTSKWCPKCGRYGRRVGKGKEFVCDGCGLKVNADRVASLNIALRAAKVMHNHNMSSSQYSEGRESVNTLGWQDEGEGVESWHGYLAPDCKPTTLVVGS